LRTRGFALLKLRYTGGLIFRTLVNRTFRVCLLGAACRFAPADPQAVESAPKRIFGLYGPAGSGRDSIRVIPGSKGQVSVAIKLYYDNGHTCQLDRSGAWTGDHVTVTADGLNPNEPCQLNAYFPQGRILLKDEGLRCAPVYCGTRGKLDAVSLIRKRSLSK
jgi:hypothetical protein